MCVWFTMHGTILYYSGAGEGSHDIVSPSIIARLVVARSRW
jgi:hypothetical protein